MKLTVVPVLQSLRAIYNVEGVMPRFHAYLDVMIDHGEAKLPLGAFSPMGKAQPEYLDKLLEIDAEGIAEKVAKQVEAKMAINSSSLDELKLCLVVVDAPEGKNTWTHRYVTDTEWRLEGKYDIIPGEDVWSTVQLWTDQPPTEEYVVQETRASIARGVHRMRFGIPTTLQELMQQEGRAMAFGGCQLELDEDDLEYSRAVIRDIPPTTTDYPTCFAALYGDEIAKSVGYTPLGLSHMAGFQVALADALEKGDEKRLAGNRPSKAGKRELN